jgi:PKD repeat protein
MEVNRFRVWALMCLFSLLPCFLTIACATDPATPKGNAASGASTPFVQVAAQAASGTSSSLSVAFGRNTSAGDLILVGFDYSTAAELSSISDSQGNAFAQIGSELTSPGGARSRLYYAKNIKGGADTVTINLSANSSYIEVYLTEYSGIDPNNPIDGQAGASGNAGAASSGNMTTTVAGDVIFGYCVGDWACTAGSGFTARSTMNSNLIEDMLAGAPGTYAATGSANMGWSMQAVALKPASGVGSGTAAPVITSATTATGTVGSAFSYQIVATNSPTSYGTAGGLPSGLWVNTTTGLISGTPTTAGTSTATISATNAGGTGSATLTLTINASAPSVPAITSATTAGGTVGAAFSYQITASNSPTSFGATGLPAGLSVNTSSGLISGTPTTAGTSTVTLSATNAGGTGTASLTVTINPAPPTITSATTASGKVGTAFSYQITASNSPTSFGAAGLPAGLSVSSTTGLISGTPTAAGSSTVTLSATNAGGTGTASLTVTINPAAPAITSATTASGTVGTSFSYQITATNSPTSFGATGLPTGLSVSSTTGLISGTPTAAGSSTVTLSATNAGGTGNATLTLTVNSSLPAAPVITSATTASGTVGTAFSYQIAATNSPTSFGATGLPTGLSVNTSSGLISGTPTATGTSSVTISATNAGGTGSATLTLTINPTTPVITSATSANGTVGTAFSYQIAATNSPTSFGATGLPAGLSVSSTTGLISGTPTAAGTSTVTLSATNAGGTGNATLTVTINPSLPAAPVITSALTASGKVGAAFSYQITASNSPTSFGATGLPTGLSLSSTSGLISGTPTAAGTSSVTLSATNAGGTGNATLTITIGMSSNQLIALSANGKYLVNANTGQPVFIVGDDAFDLVTMLSASDITAYMTDRGNRGFNVLWIAAADNGFSSNPPKNFLGNSPFDGADFTNEDSNYWSNLDSIITEASNQGITVFLMPFFVGNGGEPGYLNSVLDSSDSVMSAFGTFLGNRYKNANNIVWLLGGDSLPSTSGLYQKLNDVGAAIAAADPNHLITLEACEACVTNGYNSVQAFQTQGLAVPSWLTLNWAYPTIDDTVAAANASYTQTPFLPPLCGENFYELEHNLTEPQVRFEQYTEVLSGCYLGRIFGNGAIWSFDSPNGSTCCTNGMPTWQSQLGSAGSVSQEYQGRLFRSREHWLLVPDINHNIVTLGFGSGLTMTTAARTSDGQTIIAYIPNGSLATISVNMGQITSATNTVQAWWFNPQTAATTNAGTFANTGIQVFIAPDSNDWVLVLDDANAGLVAPGTTVAGTSN